MTCTIDDTQLDEVDAGSEAYIGITFRATPDAPTAASTAITFTLHQPDGTLLTASNGSPSVTGPTAGTETIDGVVLTTTRWVYKTPVLTISGRYDIAAASTAGIVRTERGWFRVPSYSPFLSP